MISHLLFAILTVNHKGKKSPIVNSPNGNPQIMREDSIIIICNVIYKRGYVRA